MPIQPLKLLRVPLLQRVAALFLVAGFALFTAESGVAELHIVGAVGIQADHGAPNTHTSGPAGGRALVCHCVHAHGAVVALEENLDSAQLVSRSSICFALVPPPFRSIEPGLRPPIA